MITFDNNAMMALEKALKNQQNSLKRTQLEIIVLAILMLFMIAYLSFLYINVKTLDASQVSSMIGQAVEKSLPDIKKDFKQKGLDYVPAFTDQFESVVLDLPKLVRTQIEEHSKPALWTLGESIDGQLDLMIRETLENSLLQLDQAYPDKTTDEKIDLLLTQTHKDFEIHLSGLLDTFYNAYASELIHFNDKLNYLNLTHEVNLTTEERIHKELIQAWVVLSKKYNLFQSTDE